MIRFSLGAAMACSATSVVALGCAPATPAGSSVDVADVAGPTTPSASAPDDFVPRRRLEHTLTLGTDDNLPGARPVAVPASGSNVTVQNVYVLPQQSYGYGGYGSYGTYGPSYGGTVYPPTTFHHTPVNPVTGTPPVAGDWPAPPSYGPRTMR